MKKTLRSLMVMLLAVCMMVAVLPAQAYAAGGDRARQEKDLRYLRSWPSAPSISARSAFVLEVNSGEVLFAQNENETRYPASITKVMTALLAVENCRLDEMVTFSATAVGITEDGGRSYEYLEGETLTMEQVLHALLLDSVNECGNAIAEHVAGSVDAFVEMMNARAVELGCTKTSFHNPHGLTDSEHTTTAHDMARIFWAALQNDDFFRICSAINYSIPATAKNPAGYEMTNHHKMMLSGGEYSYEGVIAGKTGYTSAAKNTLLTYAEKDGAAVIVAVLKAEGSGKVYEDTKKLLDYAFKNFHLVDLSGQADEIISGLSAAYPFPVKADSASAVFLPNAVEGVSVSLTNKGAFDASGIVGHITYMAGDEELSTSDIVVDEERLAASVARQEVPSTGETGEAQTGDDPAAETTAQAVQPEKPAKKHMSVIWIILLLFLAAFAGLFIYWLIIQEIKKRRAREKKRARLEAMRRQRRRGQ